jgi:leucyl aminopeptidase
VYGQPANDDLATELDNVCKVTGDKIWWMPLAAEYNEQLESKIADIKNIGGPYGGAITAALFLQNFVSKKKPFAHIDIAGPVWDDKIGATGFGVKLVTKWVRRATRRVKIDLKPLMQLATEVPHKHKPRGDRIALLL